MVPVLQTGSCVRACLPPDRSVSMIAGLRALSTLLEGDMTSVASRVGHMRLSAAPPISGSLNRSIVHSYISVQHRQLLLHT